MATSSETSTLTCIGCAKVLEPDTKFCPYCRTEQKAKVEQKPVSPPESEKPKTHPVFVTEPPTVPPPAEDLRTPRSAHQPYPYSTPGEAGQSPAKRHAVGGLVLRPSSQIWEFTEREDPVAPGTRRPFLVLDEQTVHLSHTDRKLEPEELLQRVQQIIVAYEVPVQVELETARWQSDRGEGRPRIIASLFDHAYSDYKMIFGVDYLGRWASIKMYLAVEPPVLPPVPAPQAPPGFSPIWAIVMAIVGLFFLTSALKMVGIGLLIGAIFVWRWEKSSYDASQKEARQKYNNDVVQQKAEVEEQAQMKSLFRTYKIDDMRLFSSAMNTVFRAVIDDIITKDGAKVERVEGGKGGFLNEDGVTSMAPAPKKSDAADTGL